VNGGGFGYPSGTKEGVVGFSDKMNNKAKELRGRMKRNAGEVTGDRGLQARGRAEEMAGNLRQAGEKLKDAFRGRSARPRPRRRDF
jgi:uncharacterized protein YjbJ (UPF0337 family)